MVDWGTEMSPEVAASIQVASQAVKDIVVNWMEQAESCQN
jgi:hypothetical protein